MTGASSGIGLELAKQFAQHGYDLVVAADDDAIRDVPEKLSQWSSAVQAVQVDLRTGIRRSWPARSWSKPWAWRTACCPTG
ncbi:SDR family NAD(P)-dependent oxidoreductase [Mycobacterium sp. E787]|uniref:SDR family NAD(P)-dependent oxidoreductase n=1 Tax=Mycobacterium sp. E787 TaxID=1834150 RepID=UPI001E57D1D7|nr:SDR family NAD(P)-dependent oxidoreductase [Mycobacterium sp. E787]